MPSTSERPDLAGKAGLGHTNKTNTHSAKYQERGLPMQTQIREGGKCEADGSPFHVLTWAGSSPSPRGSLQASQQSGYRASHLDTHSHSSLLCLHEPLFHL